jgi:uncharacterized membrane protein
VSAGGSTGAATRSRLALAGLLAITGSAHVLAPTPFEQIIPRWLPGSPRLLNRLATAAELGSAALLTTRRTGRVGGVLACCTFAGVWIANVHAALQGGYRALPGWLGGPTAAWLRVPLQVPLLWWAASVARRTDPDRTDRPTKDQA